MLEMNLYKSEQDWQMKTTSFLISQHETAAV